MNQQQQLQVIHKGQLCDELLRSEAFNILQTEITSEIYNEFNAIEPCVENKDMVYDLKLQLEALKRIISRCRSHVIAGENVSKILIKEEKNASCRRECNVLFKVVQSVQFCSKYIKKLQSLIPSKLDHSVHSCHGGADGT